MKVLVTGATGFTGRYLLEELISAENGGHEVISVSRGVSGGSSGAVTTFPVDLTDYPATVECIRSLEPDAIVHLAGLRTGDLDTLFSVNVKGTKNLLDAVHESSIDPVILVISSSAVYGYAGDRPITEETPCRPVNDYGVSKVAQEAIALSCHLRYGLKVAVARPFNLTGPGQDQSFVLGKLVHRWVESEKSGDEIELLNTNSKRDFIDIRDAVRAYCTIIENPVFEESCAGKVFNIGSGKAHSVDDAVGIMNEITDRPVSISVHDDGFRELVPFQESDITTVRSLGWRPEIPFRRTLLDMYTYARRKNQ